jgi:hypothetical protein
LIGRLLAARGLLFGLATTQLLREVIEHVSHAASLATEDDLRYCASYGEPAACQGRQAGPRQAQ